MIRKILPIIMIGILSYYCAKRQNKSSSTATQSDPDTGQSQNLALVQYNKDVLVIRSSSANGYVIFHGSNDPAPSFSQSSAIRLTALSNVVDLRVTQSSNQALHDALYNRVLLSDATASGKLHKNFVATNGTLTASFFSEEQNLLGSAALTRNYSNYAAASSGDPAGAGQILEQGNTGNAMNLQQQQQSGPYDILAYGKECAEKLGPIPSFNCLDDSIFIEVPITRNNGTQKVKWDSDSDSWAWYEGSTRIEDFKNDDSCDKPVYLGQDPDSQCNPDNRIGRLPKQPGFEDVHTVAVCRRYWVTMKDNYDQFPWPDSRRRDAFKDVAIVQNNEKTGDTCWFQMLAFDITVPKNGSDVPSPSAEPGTEVGERAKDFWLSPQSTAGINCYRCHDSGAYMVSPLYAQAIYPSSHPEFPNEPVIPQLHRDPETARRIKYNSIGRYFSKWPALTAVEPKVNPLAAGNHPEAACVSCHRIGTRATCQSWAPDALNISREFANIRTDMVQEWMPPRYGSNLPHFVDYDDRHKTLSPADFEKAKNAIMACCGSGQDECNRYQISSRKITATGSVVSEGLETSNVTTVNSRIDYFSEYSPSLITIGNFSTDGQVTGFSLKAELTIPNDDVDIFLVSPNNTKYRVHANSGGNYLGEYTLEVTENSLDLLSVLGEESGGDWKLMLDDQGAGNVPVVLKSAFLTIRAQSF